MNFSNYKKILLIRLSSLGDVLLTTPLLRTIKNLHSHLQIDYLIRNEYISCVEFSPHIDEVIKLNRDYKPNEVRKLLVKNNYDVIIDLQNNLRSRVLTKGLSAKKFRYKKPYLDRFLLVNFKINRYKEVLPIPVRYSHAIPNFQLDEKGLELYIPKKLNSQLDDSNKYIGICPGSRHKTKMWPPEYFIELGKMFAQQNYRIVLFGGKDDQKICNEMSESIPDSIDLSNDNDLYTLAINMKKCKTIICNDSGLMHTSVAVGIPVVSVFGSTVKELGFFPYGGKNLVLENNSLSCRPCSHIGLDECPKKHFKCMKDIKPEIVFNEILKFIDNS